MTQHSMGISDGPGSTVLAAMNSAFQALASTNSGTSRPSTPYNGQLWIDTDTPSSTVWSLFMYDGAGDIKVGEFNTSTDKFTPFIGGIPLLAASPRGHIAGLTLSNNTGTPNTVLDIAAGDCTADDATYGMALAAFSKNCNAAWAAGTGNGALDTGSSLSNNTWYHVWVIMRPDTGVVDVLLSTSATSPTMPTSYTKKRRIGSIKTNGSAQIIAFKQIEDTFYWGTQVQDANTTTLGSTATLFALTVPTGVKVKPIIRAMSNSSTQAIILTSPDETDVAPSGGYSTTPGYDLYSGGGDSRAFTPDLWTDTSAQIRARAQGASTTFAIYTRGWRDSRGRFA